MLRLRRLRDQEGFTLVEVVVAGAVFALAAGALLSVLVAGIRTAGFAKDRTLAKDLGRERLEEMRRLPYYVSYVTFPRRTDLLDFYFPDLQNPSTNPFGSVGPAFYDSATQSYTVVFDFEKIPSFPRYRMEIVSRFVDQNLATVTPPSTYAWDSEGNDRPPSPLLATEVRLFWGPLTSSTFVLRSFLGEPRLGDLVVGGSVGGTVVRIDTAFSDFSTLLVEGGVGSSSIYVGNVTSARNDTTAARARVTLSDGTVSEILGARAVAGAPPDTGPFTANAEASSLPHPTLPLLLPVATLGTSQVSEVEAKVTADGPAARGWLRLKPGDSESTERGITATNEVGVDARRFELSKPFVSVATLGGSIRPAMLKTECATNPDDVTCRAPGSETGTREIRLIPVTYGGFPNNGYLITITFTALEVEAKASRLGAAGSPGAKARFEGTLTYMRLKEGADSEWEQVSVPLNSDDVLPNALPDAAARASTCLLKDSLTGECIVTLADYIVDWQALEAGTASVSADGRTAQASLDGVVQVTTQPTDSLKPNSGFLINVGTLRAEAVDNR